MAPQRTGQLVLWVLVIGLLVTGALAVMAGRDRHRLTTALTQLEAERTQLSEELAAAHQTVESQTTDLAHLQAELASLQASLEDAELEVRRLQVEQASLQQANEGLSARLDVAQQENQAIEARLSSLKELKLAIREMKRKLWRQRWQAWLDRVQIARTKEHDQLVQGNRGFVIRNGIPTLGSVTKLQVRVLEPQTE